MNPSSPLASAEIRRLAALQALELLDTAPEMEFDALARLAVAVTGCQTAFIAFIDAHRMWVKASVGTIPGIVPRGESLCDNIIRTDAALIVEDLAADPRFHDHWVIAAGSRFYAGLPIRTANADGVQQPVGTLCVLDATPRTLSAEQRLRLEDLARVLEALVVSRRATRYALNHAASLERQQRVFHQTERMAKVGSWRLTLADDHVEWSEGIFRIHELDPTGRPALANALDFYPPSERAMVSQALADAIESGRPFDLESDFITARGNTRRVRSMGEVEWTDGRPSAVVGVFRDVSDEHALALALRHSAETDPLTHMPNRSAFTRTLDKAVTAARATRSPLALALIDLDGFKRINDTFGHPVGDEVLKRVAAELHAPWLKGSCAVRLGGDEFAIIIDDAALLADEDGLVGKLESELRVQTCIDGLTLESGASIGLMRFDSCRFAGQRELIQAADARLYAAKRRRVGDRRGVATRFPTAA